MKKLQNGYISAREKKKSLIDNFPPSTLKSRKYTKNNKTICKKLAFIHKISLNQI